MSLKFPFGLTDVFYIVITLTLKNSDLIQNALETMKLIISLVLVHTYDK